MYTDFTTKATDTCCWCGESKTYEIPNKGESYSLDMSKHGSYITNRCNCY